MSDLFDSQPAAWRGPELPVVRFGAGDAADDAAGADGADYVDFGDGIRTPPAGSEGETDYVDFGDGIRTPPGAGGSPSDDYTDFGDGARTPAQPSDPQEPDLLGESEVYVGPRPVVDPDPIRFAGDEAGDGAADAGEGAFAEPPVWDASSPDVADPSDALGAPDPTPDPEVGDLPG